MSEMSSESVQFQQTDQSPHDPLISGAKLNKSMYFVFELANVHGAAFLALYQ